MLAKGDYTIDDLSAPVGKLLVQVNCQIPARTGIDGWEWTDHLNEFQVVDEGGTHYTPFWRNWRESNRNPKTR